MIDINDTYFLSPTFQSPQNLNMINKVVNLRYLWILGYLVQLILTIICNTLLIYVILRPRRRRSNTKINIGRCEDKLRSPGRMIYLIILSIFRHFVKWYRQIILTLNGFLNKCPTAGDGRGYDGYSGSFRNNNQFASTGSLSKFLPIPQTELERVTTVTNTGPSELNQLKFEVDAKQNNNDVKQMVVTSCNRLINNNQNNSTKLKATKGGIKKTRINLLIAWLSFCDFLIIFSLPIYMKYELFTSDSDSDSHSVTKNETTLSSLTWNYLSDNNTTQNQSFTGSFLEYNSQFFSTTPSAVKDEELKDNSQALMASCQEMILFHFFNDFSGFNNSLSTTYLAYDRFRAIYKSMKFKSGFPISSPVIRTNSIYKFYAKDNGVRATIMQVLAWLNVQCTNVGIMARILWPIFVICFIGLFESLPVTIILTKTGCNPNVTQEKYYLVYSTVVGILLPLFITTGFYGAIIVLLSNYHFNASPSSTQHISKDISNQGCHYTSNKNLRLNGNDDKNCCNNTALKPLIDQTSGQNRDILTATSSFDTENTTEISYLDSSHENATDLMSAQNKFSGSAINIPSNNPSLSSSLTSLIHRFQLGHKRVRNSRRNEIKAIRMAMILIVLRTCLIAPLTVFQILEIAGYISLSESPQSSHLYDAKTLGNPKISKPKSGGMSSYTVNIIVNAMNIFGLTDRWANVIVIVAFCESFKKEFSAIFMKHI